MTGAQISQLFDRLGRLVAATKQKSGNSIAWDYTFPNGETHTYVIRGLKSPAEAEDNAFNLLIWIWNAKDYLKERARAKGKDARLVEDIVNSNIDLQVCGDLANRLKHGELINSRSGWYPRLGKISFEVPQAAMGTLTFGASNVEMEIAYPNLVEFHLPIIDPSGAEIGDALEYAARGVSTLERIHVKVEH